MHEPDGDALHPGPVELTQYARGRLNRGHAVAILAHAAVCGRCGQILAALSTTASRPAPRPKRDRIGCRGSENPLN